MGMVMENEVPVVEKSLHGSSIFLMAAGCLEWECVSLVLVER